MDRRGIILGGGTGSRLFPTTLPTSKHLLPIYDKPMVYYPTAMLMLAGIRDILFITTQSDQAGFRRLLGDGSQWGCAFQYAVQDRPNGIAEALLIGESFVAENPTVLALGDNIFYGNGFERLLNSAMQRESGATIFGYQVNDASTYGVIEFDRNGAPLSIEEKPDHPKSRYAVTGLYFYDSEAPELARSLTPSKRGELEITDLNRAYLAKGALATELMGRGFAWLDTGTPESLLAAANYVKVIEQRQGMKIWCPEEIAWRKGYIDDARLEELAEPLRQSGYGTYLLELLHRPPQ